MKIAVPTNDGTTISDHFGRSAAFLVFEIESGKITASTTRPNNACHSHEAGHGHGDAHANEPHSHGAIVATLADCEVVLCRGMGQRASDALAARGTTPVFVKETGPAQLIVEAYAAGTLGPVALSPCHCSR